MGSTESATDQKPEPPPEKACPIAEDQKWLTRCWQLDENHRLTDFLPVKDLPRLVHESYYGDGEYTFSIRSDDETLFKAYWNKFLETWRPYISIRHGPSHFANGEWCVTCTTSLDMMKFWIPSFSL